MKFIPLILPSVGLLSSTPRVFTKMLIHLIARLQALLFHLIIYLDDILIMGSSYDETSRHLKITVDLLQSVGFLISLEKFVLSQTIEFLGLNIHSKVLTLSLYSAKVDSIVAFFNSLLQKDRVKLRDITKVFVNIFLVDFPQSPLPRVFENFLYLVDALFSRFKPTCHPLP